MVTVRGEATAEVAPELARVGVTVTARDRDRARVLRDLDERARAVDEVLDRHTSAIEHVETEALRVNPQFATNKPRERVSGYEGSFRRTVVLHDFEPLGDLLALLADNELTSVVGPWWSLRPDSEAHRGLKLRSPALVRCAHGPLGLRPRASGSGRLVHQGGARHLARADPLAGEGGLHLNQSTDVAGVDVVAVAPIAGDVAGGPELVAV